MKKPYLAPALFAESFLTTEHISSCDVFGTPNVGNQDECSYTFQSKAGIIEVFTEMANCMFYPEMVQDYLGSGQLLIGS